MTSKAEAFERGKRDRIEKPARGNPFDPETKKALADEYDRGWTEQDQASLAADFAPPSHSRV